MEEEYTMVDSRVFLSADSQLLSALLTSSVLYFIILHNIAPMFYGKYLHPVSQNQEIPTVDNYNIVTKGYVNPSNAKATFVQSTQMQIFLKTL